MGKQGELSVYSIEQQGNQLKLIESIKIVSGLKQQIRISLICDESHVAYATEDNHICLYRDSATI